MVLSLPDAHVHSKESTYPWNERPSIDGPDVVSPFSLCETTPLPFTASTWHTRPTMVRSVLCSAVLGAASLATHAACPDLQSFLHAAASGWALGQPGDMTVPLRGAALCSTSSVGPHGAMCIARVANGKEAQGVASVWLHELKTCLQAKPSIGGVRSVAPTGGTSHAVMEFEPVEYRGLPLRMSLRITEDPRAPSVAWVVQPVLGGVLATRKPEDNVCPMVMGLLEDRSRLNQWKDWAGPVLEESEGETQYICAKVPHQAASRFDCELRIGQTSNEWQTRWAYPLSMTDRIYETTEQLAKNIAACDVGLDWKKGKARHVIDSTERKVRIHVVGNKNDVGRGPSVTLRMQYWK